MTVRNVYVIAEDHPAARKLGGMIARGEVPPARSDRDAVLTDWASQPAKCRHRYRPFRVTAIRTHDGPFLVAQSEELDTENVAIG